MATTKKTVVDGKKIIEKGAGKIKDADFETVLEKSQDIEDKFKKAKPLKRFLEDVELLIAIVKDYIKGNYKQVPRWTIAAIAFALLYVLNPIDLIPDFIPVIGFLDDIAVISACLLMVEKDLKEYKEWKSKNAG